MSSDEAYAILRVPLWAYDMCYYYLAIAIVVMLTSVTGIVAILLVPGAMKTLMPTMGMVAWFIITGVTSVVISMMQFWICRSALRPGREGFAVKCSSVADCTGVMGTPQPSGLCECGARGLCGGCTMQNDMEPSMLPAYSEPLSG